MLITTSLVSNTFWSVCFVVLFRALRAGEKISMGGLALNTLKKLKGDKFTFPLASMVLAKQIGRGETAPKRYPCNFPVAILCGSIDSIPCKGTQTLKLLKI